MAAVFSLRTYIKQAEKLTFAFVDASLIPQSEEEIPAYFDLLNGAKRATLKEALVTSFAVIIDNHPRSFPQEGLDKADLVFEVPVEGGATRFLAFFNSEDAISKIGPVRSARLYFADIAEPLKSAFAHAGGSPQALAYLKGSNIRVVDVDEIGQSGKYFWRDKLRRAPHNLFTSSTLLQEAFKSLAQEKDKDIVYEDVAWSWQETSEKGSKAEQPLQDGSAKEATRISIDYSTSTYQVEYRYDSDKGAYTRLQGGRIYETSDYETLRIDNVVIAYMAVTVIDGEGRLKIETVGSGEAFVCMYGECRAALWKRDDSHKQITFFQNESPVRFIPDGHSWIHIVPVGRKVVLEK